MSRIISNLSHQNIYDIPKYFKPPNDYNLASNLRKVIARYCLKCQRDTYFFPLNVLLSVLILYFVNPRSEILNALIFPSYRIEPNSPNDPVLFGKGPKDLLFILYWAFFFGFIREFIIHKVLRPVVLRAGVKKSKVKRFLEQSYTLLYFSVFAPFGLYIMKRLPTWYFNTEEFWLRYPHKEHTGIFKCYYLSQFAYWTQQAFVLIMKFEKPRKDYAELVAHHIVTIFLIGLSYTFHFTWIGLSVFITMDSSDIFLALSKLLNYLDSPLTTLSFTIFVGVWIYTRHYLNLKFLWSVLTEFETIGPYGLNWSQGQFKCIWSQIATFVLLSLLQMVNLYWLTLILIIAYEMVATGKKKDSRSDDEDDDYADEDIYSNKKQK